MKGKIVSIVLAIMMVGIAFTSFAVAGDPPPPDDITDGVQYIDGDWVVGLPNNTFTNEIIYLTGNLTIPAGVTLTLINTTILMNCSADGEYHIEVESNGALIMQDGGDGLTPMDAGDADSSIITANNTANEHQFWVRPNAVLIASNSEIHYVGFEYDAPFYNNSGVLIQSNNVMINNCLIEDNFCGLIYDSCFPATLAFNLLDNNVEKGLWITNITNPAYNINGVLSDNTITNSGSQGVLITAPNINIEVFNMNVSENNYGLHIIADQILNANVHHNQFWRNSGLQHGGSSLYLLTNGTGTIDAVVENNGIFENYCGGLWIGYEYNGIATNHTTALVANNSFIGNDGDECIQGNASINAKIVDNYFGGSTHLSKTDTMVVGHKTTPVFPANKFCDDVIVEFSRNQIINDGNWNTGGAFKVAGLDKINATIIDNYILSTCNVGGAMRIGHPGESTFGYTGDYSIVQNLNAVVIGNQVVIANDPDVGDIYCFHAVNNINLIFTDNYATSDSDQNGEFLQVGWWGSGYGDPTLFVNATVEDNTFLFFPDDYCGVGGMVSILAEEYINLKFNNNRLEFWAYYCGGARFADMLQVGNEYSPDYFTKNLTAFINGNTFLIHDHYGGYITGGVINIMALYNTNIDMRDNIVTLQHEYYCTAYYGTILRLGGQPSGDYYSVYSNITLINNQIYGIFQYDAYAGGAIRIFATEEANVLMNENLIIDTSTATPSYEDSASDFGVRIGYICDSNGVLTNYTNVISNNNTIGPGGKNSNLKIGALKNLTFTSNGDEIINARYGDNGNCNGSVLSNGNGITLLAKNITATITDAYIHRNQGAGICVQSEYDTKIDITDSVITQNRWHGIYLESLRGIVDGTGSIKNTEITMNGDDVDGDIGELGSGIWCKEANLDIVNCTFNNPTGDVELEIMGESTVTALNTTFNKAKVFIEGITPAILEGNAFAEDDFSVWAVVTDGSFRITIDGDAQNIDGIDFTGDANMNDVAATVQGALQAVGTGGFAAATCVFDTDHFKISSGTTGLSTSISTLSTSTGTVGTDISGLVASTNGFWLGGTNGTTSTGTGSWLLVQWYMHVKAEQLSTGLGLPLTDVIVRDIGANIDDSGVTALDGYRRWLITDEYYQTTTTKTFFTPHTVDATKAPVSGLAGPITMDESKEVVIVLDYITQPPVANAGPDQTVPENTTVTLDGSGSTDDWQIVNWSWSCVAFNGTLNGETVNFTFTVPGVYTVTLTVTDFEGYTDTDEVNITVTDETNPIADAGPDQTVNEDTVVTFDGSGSTDLGGITNYTWTFTDGTAQVLYGVGPTYIFAQPGIYTVTLTVIDIGSNIDTDTVVITVLDITAPIPVLSAGQTIEEGSTGSFDGSGSSDNVGIVQYEWIFNDGSNDVVLPGSSMNYTFNVLGNHTVTLTVTDAAGNSASGNTWVNVIDLTPPIVLVTAPGENLAGVPLDWSLVIVFSEPMNTASVEAAFNITGTSVSSFTWETGNRYVTVNLDSLTYGTTYAFTVGTGSEDLAGNNLASEYTGSFTSVTSPAAAESPSFFEDYWWIIIVIILVVVIIFQALRGKGGKDEPISFEEETPPTQQAKPQPEAAPKPAPEPKADPTPPAEPPAE